MECQVSLTAIVRIIQSWLLKSISCKSEIKPLLVEKIIINSYFLDKPIIVITYCWLSKWNN